MKVLVLLFLLAFAPLTYGNGALTGVCTSGKTGLDVGSGTSYACVAGLWQISIQPTPTATKINGHALSSDVTITPDDVLPSQTGNSGIIEFKDATKSGLFFPFSAQKGDVQVSYYGYRLFRVSSTVKELADDPPKFAHAQQKPELLQLCQLIQIKEEKLRFGWLGKLELMLLFQFPQQELV